MKNDLINYKGYDGSVNYDKENDILHGKVEFIRALINYEAKDLDNLKKAFFEAIDDYLEFCNEKGVEPEKPFKGGFNVRVGEDRHRKAWMIARALNKNLNDYICSVLDESFERISPSTYENNETLKTISVSKRPKKIAPKVESAAIRRAASNKEKKNTDERNHKPRPCK